MPTLHFAILQRLARLAQSQYGLHHLMFLAQTHPLAWIDLRSIPEVIIHIMSFLKMLKFLFSRWIQLLVEQAYL